MARLLAAGRHQPAYRGLVIVGTPGRLQDVVAADEVAALFAAANVLVLDEADKLLSMGNDEALAAIRTAIRPYAAQRVLLCII